jgi:hypothetical protein
MMDGLRRRQQGQAVVLVAVTVLLLAGILMLALDAGGEYLDRRQMQSAVDAAALAGAELLMALPPSDSAIHYQGLSTLVTNLPGTSLPGSCDSVATCPNTATLSSVTLGSGYTATLSIVSNWKYKVQLQHTHATAVAPIHGFQSTIQLAVAATAQNQNVPYAIVLLDDQFPGYSNLTMSGAPVSLTLTNASGVSATRGGVFSNESIDPAAGDIYFAPSSVGSTSCGTGGTAGDLWAVQETAHDSGNAQNETFCGAQGGTAPNYSVRTASKLAYPNYAEPPVCNQPTCTYSGPNISSGTTVALCPGTYTNDIVVGNNAVALLLPGVYRVSAGGVLVNGTLRTLSATNPSDFNGAGQYLGPIPLGGWVTGLCTAPTSTSDLGVTIEIFPAKNNTTGTCDLHVFKVGGSGASVTLTPSLKYLNISLYIETLSGWMGCPNPYGTNVVQIQSASYYNIQGTIYGPFDNMNIGGGAAGSGVGQIVAWTLKLNGNGTITETFNPAYQPYLKGLIQ